MDWNKWMKQQMERMVKEAEEFDQEHKRIKEEIEKHREQMREWSRMFKGRICSDCNHRWFEKKK